MAKTSKLTAAQKAVRTRKANAAKRTRTALKAWATRRKNAA